MWSAAVAYVDQGQPLFEGTVKDGGTHWDPEFGDDEIIAALTDACIYEVIAQRPGGLSSAVAEDGRNFSYGQRQRLEIARALVRRPSLLILDEATSALDPETEVIIDNNLRRRGATCLIIAHRLSTIRDCDLIMVLNAGGELERGTRKEELFARRRRLRAADPGGIGTWTRGESNGDLAHSRSGFHAAPGPGIGPRRSAPVDPRGPA